MSEQRFEAVASEGGRVLVGRLLPGADLIQGLEAVCDRHHVRYAAVSFAYGSLSRASFKVLHRPTDGAKAVLVPRVVEQRVEFLGGQGLVCADDSGGRDTHLHGSIADHLGTVQGGHFVAGENPIFNNLDFTLVELLGVHLIRKYDEETDTIEMEVRRDEQGASR